VHTRAERLRCVALHAFTPCGEPMPLIYASIILAIGIGTRGSWDVSNMLTCHIFVGLPTVFRKMKVVAIVYFSWVEVGGPILGSPCSCGV
jgi:hypothetical protein